MHFHIFARDHGIPINEERMASTSKFVRILGMTALWLVTLLVAAIFAIQGGLKFFNDSIWTKAFAHWGYPVWFRILIGIMETFAAILIVVPRLAAYGATLVIAIMIGGIATNLRTGEPRQVIAELVWIVMASIVLVIRRRNAVWPSAKGVGSAS